MSLPLLGALILLPAGLQAQITVEGVSDRGVYSSARTVRVPSVDGFSYAVWLDGKRIPTDTTMSVVNPDYHEVLVERTDWATANVESRLVRFIIRASGRGSSESGLPPWEAYPPIPSAPGEFAGAQLRLIAPRNYPMDLEIPMVAWVENGAGHAVRVNGWVAATGHPSIEIKRGVGSILLPPAAADGPMVYDGQLHALQDTKQIEIEEVTTWTPVFGTLNGNVEWPENSRISVEGDLTIPNGSSLTVGAGSVVRLNGGIDIHNYGAVTISGTVDDPVVFTPVSPAQPWGGFILYDVSPNAATLTASGTVFTGSGADPDWFGTIGPGSHRGEQGLFYAPTTNVVTMVDCAAIDLAGQLGHAYNGGTFTFTRFLLQRCTTGGEYSGSSRPLVFRVNDSAFIDIPDGTPNFVDGDNDALYIVHGTSGFTNTLFGWTKDDGIDCGGSGAGLLELDHCWFDSILHEGTSLSGNNKRVFHYNGVLLNNGQAVECGYNGPIGHVDHCLILNNLSGVRFADNYDWTYTGFISSTNALLLHNYRNIWGRNWADWTYRLNQMDVRSNLVSRVDTNHPNNTLWDPAQDAWRLVSFLTTPPDAPVGMGLAVWNSSFPMTSIFNGTPIRLSMVSTNTITVDYTFQAGGNPIATGTLTFEPGEMLKLILPAGFKASDYSQVDLVLSNPTGAELTGETTVSYTGSVSLPSLSLAVATTSLPMVRIEDGLFVRLTGPSTDIVSVEYQFEADSEILEAGTLTMAPLQTLARIFLTNTVPYDYQEIQLILGNVTGATPAGITSVTFVNPPLTLGLTVPASQLALDTYDDGVPVGLSAPAPSLGVSVDFTVQGGAGLVTNGTLTFSAGQSAAAIVTPTVDASNYDLLRVNLSNPVRATFAGPTEVYYVRTSTAPPQTNTTLIAWGADWKYLDDGSDQGTTWRAVDFPDDSWDSGPAELGYGDNDEATVVSYGPDGNNKYPTTYFRHAFQVADPSLYTNLNFRLLFDDGGVVFLNGTQILRTANMPAIFDYSTYSGAGPGDNSENNGTASATLLQAGLNVLAAEIHQDDGGSSDISFNFELIATPTPVPPPPQEVYLGRFGDEWILAWGDPTFLVQESTNLNDGTWRTLFGMRTPAVIDTSSGGPKFYRIFKP